jgi:hypothetical protein
MRKSRKGNLLKNKNIDIVFLLNFNEKYNNSQSNC